MEELKDLLKFALYLAVGTVVVLSIMLSFFLLPYWLGIF